MSIPDKETVALNREELDILDAIRRTAPKHHIEPKLAQAYGVWTVCFRRYCQDQGVPWLWMSSVSDFMDFLDAHPNVSAPERNRALDGIMFYITDVHKARQDEEEDDDEPAPRSPQSLFAKMLLRCDVELTEALRLRREDVHLDKATVSLPGDDERDSRRVTLPNPLRDGMKEHVERVEDRTTSTNPLLFGRRRAEDLLDEDDDIDQSTALATRVMKTFGNDGDDAD
jgi:hypothetical protein